MKIEDTQPQHCYSRAHALLGDAGLIRDELGRAEDGRPAAEIQDAKPRECYFEALATWHKAVRLGAELGVASPRFPHPAPPLQDTRPGHVLQVIEAVHAQLDAIKQRLHVGERASDGALDPTKQPSDVLACLIRVNRELSRALERPFTPGDVYAVVALASTYAARLGGNAELAPFERKRKPAHCYVRLAACHQAVAAAIAKKGETAMSARGVPSEVLPGDVYDMATMVLGELVLLHALTPGAAPVHAFEPAPAGHRMPAHVDQLARTLEAQLAAIG